LPAGQKLVDVERRYAIQPGKEIWVSSNLTALHTPTGEPLGYMDVSRDITARKQLEAQVQAAQTQLAQAARLAAIGELASGVAHQISNPLTTVIGEAQILLRSLGPDHPGRESAEAIERGGWRAQEAVQRLLEFSRPATHTLETLALNDTIKHALDLVGAQIETAGVTLRLELAPALPPLHGNARQLEDLWVNLLLIARDAPSASAAHHISLSSGLTPEKQAQVIVHDDGQPIPPEQLVSIFEPAFAGSPIQRGTGLELSICREIVRQHHGQIRAASTPEQGTTFTVILPVKI
jgi:two-component system NtrC family sensor kinase